QPLLVVGGPQPALCLHHVEHIRFLTALEGQLQGLAVLVVRLEPQIDVDPGLLSEGGEPLVVELLVLRCRRVREQTDAATAACAGGRPTVAAAILLASTAGEGDAARGSGRTCHRTQHIPPAQLPWLVL